MNDQGDALYRFSGGGGRLHNAIYILQSFSGGYYLGTVPLDIAEATPNFILDGVRQKTAKKRYNSTIY